MFKWILNIKKFKYLLLIRVVPDIVFFSILFTILYFNKDNPIYWGLFVFIYLFFRIFQSYFDKKYNELSFELDELKINVLSIEIIDIKSDDPLQYQVTRVIIGEELIDFLNELSDISFIYTFRKIQKADGFGIKINYDSTYKIISNNVTFDYNYENCIIEKSRKEFFKNKEFIHLVNKFIDVSN